VSAHVLRFWQCQPAGYTAPPEGRTKVSVSVRQNLPKVPAFAINTGALASGFQFELNQRLATDGLSAQVSVVASDLPTGRRRLHQAGTAQVKYTVVVMVPAGKDAASVGVQSYSELRRHMTRPGPP
jgi:hypothetical protein